MINGVSPTLVAATASMIAMIGASPSLFNVTFFAPVAREVQLAHDPADTCLKSYCVPVANASMALKLLPYAIDMVCVSDSPSLLPTKPKSMLTVIPRFA